MTPIEEVFARLSATADQLNAETDTLNSVLENVDKRLEAMNVGVSCWDRDILDMEPDDDPNVAHGWQIGYTKLRNGWHLAVQRVRVEEKEGEYHPDVDAYGDPIPLLGAPRVLRLEALDRIEPLLEALAKRCEGFVEQIGNAQNRLTE